MSNHWVVSGAGSADAEGCAEAMPPELPSSGLSSPVSSEASWTDTSQSTVAPASGPAKVCEVCGDRALGYNFNAVSCESCKAFFRRHARKDGLPSLRKLCKSFILVLSHDCLAPQMERTQFMAVKCLFTGQCAITVITRRFCLACRLRKCFSVGMKKDMILDDGERKRRLEQTRMKKDKKRSPTEHVHASAGSGRLLSPSSLLLPQTPSGTASNTTCCETALDDVKGAVSSASSTWVGHTTTMPCWSALTTVHSLSRLPLESAVVHPDDLHSLQRVLAKDELARIQVLQSAYSSSLGPQIAQDALSSVSCQQIESLINLTEVHVRHLISFLKGLPEFYSLSQGTHVELLKGSVIPCLLLRSSLTFDVSAGSWKLGQGGTLPLAVLKEALASISLSGASEHATLASTVQRLVPKDSSGTPDMAVFALLQTVVMLSPEYLSPVNQDTSAVSDSQHYYLALLKRHLEASYSYLLASQLLPDLLQMVNALKHFAQQQGTTVLKACDAMRIEPLLREVYGLDIKA